jgi:hypothetical protein
MKRLHHPLATSGSTRVRLALVTAGLAAAFVANGAARSASAGGLTFTFTEGSGLMAADPQTIANVLAGVQAAGAFWSSKFGDSMTVNLTIDYAAESSSGTLANTIPNFQQVPYTTTRAALGADAKSPADAAAVAGLTSASSISFFASDVNVQRVFDNNGSTNNTTVNVLTANAKALGLPLADPTVQDASITFGNTIPWDFNHGATIAPTKYDFVGVAIHEIGHALGFSSALEVVDLLFGKGPLAPFSGDPDTIPTYTVLDLFRHSAASRAVSPTTLDLALGGTPFFSLDGTTNLGLFSTGTYNGDGWGASHWKDNLGLGIMDPTFAKGEKGIVTPLDLEALDVLGYDPIIFVPEPSTLILAALAVLPLLGRARRRWPR